MTVDDTEYYYDDGMTWEDWLSSAYNTEGLTLYMNADTLRYGCETVSESYPNAIVDYETVKKQHYVHDINYFYEHHGNLPARTDFAGDFFVFIKNDHTTEKLPVSEYENINK